MSAELSAGHIKVPGEIPGPPDPVVAMEFPNDKDDYEVTEADQQMMATGHGQLVGQFLLDRRHPVELY